MLKKDYAFVKKTETDVCSYDKVVICSFVWVFGIARVLRCRFSAGTTKD